MSEHTIRRDGDLPLQFTGELVSEASSRERDAQRWYDLALYRTDGGRWVVGIVYRTRWQGEQDYYAAHVSDLPELVSLLRALAPAEHVQGYPPGGHYEKKQRRLLQRLRLGLERAIAELFEGVEGAVEHIE